MNEILQKVQELGVVPVVVLNNAKDAAPLAKALCEGGLPCAEVTFRTEAAEESIRIMASEFPQMLIGAGTVLTTEQVDRAVAAGAKFIVSPGFDPEIVDYCLADSDYNKQELIEMGYKCQIDVLPLLIPFEDYDKVPSAKVLEKYMDDGYTNLLFVGRIAPNKKQEDIIKVFNYYKKNINSKSRLIFVGNAGGMELYYEKLQCYVKALELDDVIFTGHVGFEEILAYYRLADVFLCMSEHEGFGVPLVEAMWFDIPIIAYNSSAIPWVLGDSGVLVNNKNSILWSRLIEKILQDTVLQNEILQEQRQRLSEFSFEKTKSLFLRYLSSFQIGANI